MPNFKLLWFSSMSTCFSKRTAIYDNPCPKRISTVCGETTKSYKYTFSFFYNLRMNVKMNLYHFEERWISLKRPTQSSHQSRCRPHTYLRLTGVQPKLYYVTDLTAISQELGEVTMGSHKASWSRDGQASRKINLFFILNEQTSELVAISTDGP